MRHRPLRLRSLACGVPPAGLIMLLSAEQQLISPMKSARYHLETISSMSSSYHTSDMLRSVAGSVSVLGLSNYANTVVMRTTTRPNATGRRKLRHPSNFPKVQSRIWKAFSVRLYRKRQRYQALPAALFTPSMYSSVTCFSKLLNPASLKPCFWARAAISLTRSSDRSRPKL